MEVLLYILLSAVCTAVMPLLVTSSLVKEGILKGEAIYLVFLGFMGWGLLMIYAFIGFKFPPVATVSVSGVLFYSVFLCLFMVYLPTLITRSFIRAKIIKGGWIYPFFIFNMLLGSCLVWLINNLTVHTTYIPICHCHG